MEEYKNEDFQHGFQSGTENVSKDTYEGYLSNQVSYEWLQERISEKTTEMQRLDQEMDDTKRLQRTHFVAFQEHSTTAEQHQRNINRLETEKTEKNDKIAVIQQHISKHKTPYALLAGILYLLAGVAFVAGDLIISHEIVAYALNIRNSNEAWAFAIGLASLSILLKPAYERLVEQPYLTDYNAKTKKIYGIFQGVLLTFAIGTMVVLGWFRYEAYKTDKLKDTINKQVKALQLESQPIDPTQPIDNQALIQKMDEKLKLFDQLNLDLVNSPWALLSFVLSGVLFAIAGAICLGIAFPIIHSYWYKWFQGTPAMRKITKEIKTINEEIKTQESSWLEHQKLKNISENDLQLLPEINQLIEQKTVLQTEILALSEQAKRFDEDRRIYAYNDGYELGKTSRLTMSPEEYLALRNNRIRELQDAKDTQTDKQPKVLRNNGLRPSQALRKAISDSFYEN